MSNGVDSRQQYNDISHVMFEIMINIIEMEFAYAKTGDPQLLKIIEYNGWLLEYWEDQMYAIYGHYAYDLSLYLR